VWQVWAEYCEGVHGEEGSHQGRIFYMGPDREVSYFFVMFCYGLLLFFVMILIKVVDLLL
jgi:hypothetical protein